MNKTNTRSPQCSHQRIDLWRQLSALRHWAFLRFAIGPIPLLGLVLGLGTGLGLGAGATTAHAGLQANAMVGVGHDTRVTLAADDTQRQEQGDGYGLMQAGMGWQSAWRSGQFTSELSVRDQHWQQTQMFNTRLYSGFVHVSQQTGPVRSELTWMQAQADVDGDRYLELTRVSPAVGKKLGQSLYVRGQLDYSEKRYHNHSVGEAQRRAQRIGARVLGYWFIPNTSWSLSSTLQTLREENRPGEYQAQYDYDAVILKLALRHKSLWFGHKVGHRLQLRGEERVYAQRYDLRLRWQFSQEWQWTPQWSWQWRVRQEDHYSDRATSDYAQTRFETQLEWAL